MELGWFVVQILEEVFQQNYGELESFQVKDALVAMKLLKLKRGKENERL